MPNVDRFISVSQAKAGLLDLIRNLRIQKEVVAITRDGVPAAVLLSMDQYEELIETLEVLSDHRALSSLRRSLRQAQIGQWAAETEIFDRKNG